jgi:ARG and Rhodanese-Phosphatase-superfamily-associated Protein domain
MTTLPEVRVGDPIRHEALTVFPLFSPPDEAVEYLLFDEAIDAGSVTVEEVGEAGSVPNLLVSNTGECLVLFFEGEELKGAKQNRVLNTSCWSPPAARPRSRSVAWSRGGGDTGPGTSPRADRIRPRS